VVGSGQGGSEKYQLNGQLSAVELVRVASRPIGGVLSSVSRGMAIHLCGLPGDIGRATRLAFDLAPGGVCQAGQVALSAGALLPHRFTLTCALRPSAVCSLWHFPAGHPDSPLASTLLFGAPTFLSAPSLAHRDHPADSPADSLAPNMAWCARTAPLRS